MRIYIDFDLLGKQTKMLSDLVGRQPETAQEMLAPVVELLEAICDERTENNLVLSCTFIHSSDRVPLHGTSLAGNPPGRPGG